MIFLILAISHLLPSTPPYFNFFNNIIIYLRLFNYICNVENDNALRSHNFSPFFSSLIPTSIHTRCSYGHHGVFRSMTVLSMCLILIFLHFQIIHTNIHIFLPPPKKKLPSSFCETIFFYANICAILIIIS